MPRRSATSDRIIRASDSWDAFWRALTLGGLSSGEQGAAFERLVQILLLSRAEYRTSLRNVWRLQEVPAAVRRRLDLPRADAGIDLIAETRSGEYWAIQCKFRSNTSQALTYSELATFSTLCFARGPKFALAIAAHTSTKPVSKRRLLGNVTEIGLDTWLRLSHEDWKAIRGRAANRAVRPARRKARPHQLAAVTAAKRHFATGRAGRGKLLMPCGTGKSLTAYWIAGALRARTILVAVPSLALVKQSVEDWTREIVAEEERPLPRWLCVCSDESVGGLDQDEFVHETYDLGVPTTTDAGEISSFLRDRSPGRKIIFVTYQSSPRLAGVARRLGVTFDLAIFDEAHKTVGERSKTFATLLFDRKVSIRRRLFMTATERVVRERDEAVLSMDDPSLYGEVFHQLSFKQAIAARPPIISDYRVLTVAITDEEVRQLVRKNRHLLPPGQADVRTARELAVAVALQRAFDDHRVRHAVSFHRSIRAASAFSDLQGDLGKRRRGRRRIQSFHVSSHKSAGERQLLLDEFRAAPAALMTNARCLTEGVDVPAIDCVLFADPKNSVVDIVQAAGRALRPYAGKRMGYVLIPIVVPRGASLETFAETTEFRQVARVVTALSTQDERIVDELRAIERGAVPRGRIVEISGAVSAAMKIDMNRFAAAIRTRLWERVGRANWRPFSEARAWARALGIGSHMDWRRFCDDDKLPADLPAKPDRTYRDQGWISWGDWLGTERIAYSLREHRQFRKARSWARGLGLKSGVDWRQLCTSGKLPSDLPANPDSTYRDEGWISWGDWLGTGTVANQKKTYRSFLEARRWARRLGLKSRSEWRRFSKSDRLPSDIPTDPNQTYSDRGWVSMGDWLGTGTVAPRLRKYRPFKTARVWARSLDLQSVKDWQRFCTNGNLPTDIPAVPSNTYREQGWIGWGDWFGTGTIAPRLRKYRSFRQARRWVRSHELGSHSEWQRFCKSGNLPTDIPAAPNQTYRERGWSSWGDWLGTGTIAPRLRKYRSFPQARRRTRRIS